MPAGKYEILVKYADLGYGSVDADLDVSAASAFTASAVVSSYLGGTIRVTGNDISS